MNNTLYKLAKLFHFIPIKFLRKITGQYAILPFYHAISDYAPIHLKHLYNVRSAKSFESDLDFILKDYKPIDYHSFYYNYIEKNGKNKNVFLLTFDDGLREFHDVAAPILLRKGIPAVCFLNSGFINNKDLFFRYKASILVEILRAKTSKVITSIKLKDWFVDKNITVDESFNSILKINYNKRHYLDELAVLAGFDFNSFLTVQQPYMNSDQVKSLINHGFTFGAHSVDHPQYSDIDVDSQICQTRESVQVVQKEFNLTYKTFSFPFTDFGVDKKFFNAVFESNAPIADLTFGCAGLKKDSCENNIQRIPIELDNFTAKEIIYGEYYYYIVKSILNKNTIVR